ncbi:MAG: ThiF family adenylyltransferase [Gordonia sp. (in: high G+C Gram-positive bacteria)]
MVEILHPEYDCQKISELRGGGNYQYIDGWTHAAAALSALDGLEHVDPDTTPPAPFDVYDEAAVERRSRYIVFPWRRTIIRLPDAELFYRLKTARNRYLLTAQEQEKWGQSLIAVAGLSVGSSAVNACALTGARRFHLADADTLDVTNLNRIIGSVCDLGITKIDLSTRRTLEGDPYSTITPFPLGYRPGVADAFLGIGGEQRASIVIEEVDDIAMKIDMRRRARAAGIPVVSATDVGDNVILDVERYDIDPDYPIFHGRGESFSAGDAEDPQQRLRMAVEIVGDVLTPRMAYAASQIGRSVASWPQLGSTATMSGAIVAATARNIICGRPITSGRYRFDVEDALFGGYSEPYRWNELSPDQLTAMLRSAQVPPQPRR